MKYLWWNLAKMKWKHRKSHRAKNLFAVHRIFFHSTRNIEEVERKVYDDEREEITATRKCMMIILFHDKWWAYSMMINVSIFICKYIERK